MTGMICLLILPLSISSQDTKRKSRPSHCKIKQKKSARSIKGKKKMNQQKSKEVALGSWGGSGIELIIEKGSAGIRYDCAEAEIDSKIMISEQGNFSVEGVYIRRTPGPIRVGKSPQRQPAIFEGKVSGNTMTLSVTLTESKEKIGEFTLKKDSNGVIRRCL